MKKKRIIVTGFIGLYPTGGVSWDYIQYPLGFQRLGHDVYYVEDTGQYSTYRISDRSWDDPYDTVQYLKGTMEAFGLKDRWAYRDTYNGQCYGMSLKKVKEICEAADLFINISAASVQRDEYMDIPAKVLIDSDPMFTQLQSTVDDPLSGDPAFCTTPFSLHDYDHYFSFGENIGKEGCLIPEMDLQWTATRQPVCLDLWKNSKKKPVVNDSPVFTTVMNWSTRSKLKYNNEEWGQKDVEFRKFINIPLAFRKATFGINLAVSKDHGKELNTEMIQSKGWKITDPAKTISTPAAYQSFIAKSFAEFSVAKETYVKSNSGWFSCRSACYLASGKPVVTEQTGWSAHIPSGQGVFAFHDEASAVDALEQVTLNYKDHSKNAIEVAHEYFDSDKVLLKVLNNV